MENVTLVSFDLFRQFAAEIISTEIKKAINPNSKNSEKEKLLSRSELANELGLSTATITNYKNDGMPFYRYKRRPYFKFSEVEAFLSTKKQKK